MLEEKALNHRRRELLERAAGYGREQQEQAGQRFSIVRAVNAMVSGGGVRGGIEQETSQQNSSLEQGRFHDPFKLQLRPQDLGWHQRALITGTGSQGGYLIPSKPTGFDALADVSALVRAGAVVWSDLQTGTAALSGFASVTSAAWYSENGTATSSDPTLTPVAATPKRCVALLSVSKPVLVQSAIAEGMLNRHVLTAVGKAIDQAGLSGTSGSSNPVGVPYLTGLGTTVSGASFTGATGFSLVQKASESATDDSRIVAVAAPSARSTLSGRNVGTNVNVPIWLNGMVSNVRGLVSTNALANSVIYADWSHLQILFWGLSLEVNPWGMPNFQSDLIQLKVTAFVDIQCTYPAAFAVSTAVS